ncbi:MAG: SCO family protein [Methylotenera sp.]|nr:SCO family protein [Methylotenera sp.]
MMKILIMLCVLGFSAPSFAEPVLPSDSVYQVGGIWKTQDDQPIKLESLAGKPQLIAFIFTGCSNACPVIVESMKRIERKIPLQKRKDIGFVLLTLTPELDSPKSLKAFAKKREISPSWQMLRGNSELVRTLSNALNGRYKVIADDDVAHSNTVTLLNAGGQIEMQASGTLTGIKPIMDEMERKYAH